MFFSFKSCFIMFFSHNCKRKTVAETLPPSPEDLKEKLKAVEVDTKAPG